MSAIWSSSTADDDGVPSPETASACHSLSQLDFFGPYVDLSFEEKVDFYRHAGKWTNRMILGDSLLVMTSLAIQCWRYPLKTVSACHSRYSRAGAGLPRAGRRIRRMSSA